MSEAGGSARLAPPKASSGGVDAVLSLFTQSPSALACVLISADKDADQIEVGSPGDLVYLSRDPISKHSHLGSPRSEDSNM